MSRPVAFRLRCAHPAIPTRAERGSGGPAWPANRRTASRGWTTTLQRCDNRKLTNPRIAGDRLPTASYTAQRNNW